MCYVLKALERYNPNTPKHKKNRQNLLINAQNFYDGREIIINAFKDEIFPLDNPSNLLHYVSEEEDISPSSESPCHSEDIHQEVKVLVIAKIYH